jgi:lipoprotein-anchoring transpeptidase ErfK/SrfK
MIQVFQTRRHSANGSLYFSVAVVVISLSIFATILGFQAYAKAFKVETELANGGILKPDEPIEINFSEPMDVRNFPASFSISPPINVDYRWENSKKILIKPRTFWRLGGNYQVTIQNAKSNRYTSGNAFFQFQIEGYPSVASFSPGLGARDVMVDIEDPIVVSFTEPLEDFKVKVTTYPFQELAYQIDEEKKEIRLLPQQELSRGEKYNFEIYLKYKEEDQYRKIYETDFTTKEPLPKEWSKDLAIRVEQAKKFTDPQIKEGKYIDINLTSQTLVIFENGKLLDAYIISSGKRGLETPAGTFQIANKTPRAWSKKYGLFMPYWMALVSSGDFGIHELPEWPGGYKEGANHLGIPVSHGCVRLGIGPAERVYNWADLKTPVVIHY